MSTDAQSTPAIGAFAFPARPHRFRAWCRFFAACALSCVSAAAAAQTRVVAWGAEVGQTVSDIPYSLDDATAVSVPYVLRANGEVLEIGTMPPLVRATNATAISALGGCLLVLRGDGTVAALGTCDAPVPADLSGVVAIANGGRFGLALTADGHVRAWGDNATGQTDVPAGLTDVVAIAAGAWHALALRSDGQVVGWGSNADGQLDQPAGLANVVAIDVGTSYNLALRSDGSVVTWGNDFDNAGPVPADLPPARALGAGKWRRAAVVLTDGSIREWGFLEYKPLPPRLRNVQALAMGYTANYALVAGAITPGEAIADMRVDLGRLMVSDDAARRAMNGYLDLAAWAVRAHRMPLACAAMRNFARLVARANFNYVDRVPYFVSQSRDVRNLMQCQEPATAPATTASGTRQTRENARGWNSPATVSPGTRNVRVGP